MFRLFPRVARQFQSIRPLHRAETGTKKLPSTFKKSSTYKKSSSKINTLSQTLPDQKKPPKPWVVQGIPKDEFFQRKYGNISREERKRLDEKVDRQRRLREMKRAHERSKLGLPDRKTGGPVNGTPTMKRIRNPLYDYIFGTHSVLATLRVNKRDLYSTLYHHNIKDQEILKLAKKLGIRIIESSKQELQQLSDGAVHNGVVLETKPLQIWPVQDLGVPNGDTGDYKVYLYNDLYGTKIEKDYQVVRETPNDSQRYPLGVYLDGITDPQNIGAIFRSAYYLGVDFIIVPSSETAKLGGVAHKASAGSLEYITAMSTDEPLRFIDRIRQNGWNVITTAGRSNSLQKMDLKGKDTKIIETLDKRFIEPEDLSELLLKSPMLLVMGSEGAGVRTHIKLRSDYLVGLPRMRVDSLDNGLVDSLNVSVASALVLDKCVSFTRIN
ncbi:uncharacterized protein KQ657_001395 [Scheffersomyces spartinae]|uniref:rRNA methyltransferase 1, mitochondrial n=1 Tax=Scheffersomyces spartinae TaxID=45513 RepID=A0A9P7V7R8_9ASCO|nr:uncharacterized protein KQ657_001395 [Scheffersomyces spartinae]KAG7192938.1 hypothetical protein KQ657_001395 [Scheffersomyces spartinae]